MASKKEIKGYYKDLPEEKRTFAEKLVDKLFFMEKTLKRNVRYVPLFALFLILGIFCVKVSLVVAIILWVVAAFCAAALLLTKQIKWGAAIALVCFMFVGFGAARLDLYVRNHNNHPRAYISDAYNLPSDNVHHWWRIPSFP